MTASARFPLRPGRPFVHRWPNGRWGWSCNCLHRGHLASLRADRHNCDDWQHAMRSAANHLRIFHKTQEQLIVDTLEAWYAAPAIVPNHRQNLRRCAHCREPITGLWIGPVPRPGTHGAAPRFHMDRRSCAVAGGAYPPDGDE